MDIDGNTSSFRFVRNFITIEAIIFINIIEIFLIRTNIKSLCSRNKCFLLCIPITENLPSKGTISEMKVSKLDLLPSML